MKNRFQKRLTALPTFALLTGMLLVLFGMVFALSAQPALADPLVQGYPVATATEPGYPVATASATTGATVTAAITATATQSGTLPPPSVTGTPTVLFPVTGADLTKPSSSQGLDVGVWIALWLVGLLLIGFGLGSKLNKRS